MYTDLLLIVLFIREMNRTVVSYEDKYICFVYDNETEWKKNIKLPECLLV